jgi:hypothetical protein
MNADRVSHPTERTLSSYGLGELDDRSSEAVNQHLERCLDCRQRVAEMSAASFLERIRDAQKSASDPTFGQSRPGGTRLLLCERDCQSGSGRMLNHRGTEITEKDKSISSDFLLCDLCASVVNPF